MGTTRPLLWLAAAMAAGALVTDTAGASLPAGLLSLAGLLLVVALLADTSRAGALALSAASFALGAAGAGLDRSEYESNPVWLWVAAQAESPVAEVTGFLDADPRPVGERWRLTIAVRSLRHGTQRLTARGRVSILVGGEANRPTLRIGDEVVVWTELSRPRGFGTPGAFDAAAHAQRDGIHATGYTKSAALVTVTGAREAGFIERWGAALRARARETFARLFPAGPERGLILAMVIGDVSEIDDATAEAFRVAGTYHVLALSGTQVAAVAGVLVLLLRRAGAGPVTIALVASAAVCFYAEVVGGDVPVVRAAVMATILLWGRAIDLQSDAGNLLGLAGGLLVAAHPSSVGDVGFQLSFGATLGLVAFTAPLSRALPRLPRRAEMSLAGSLAAQITVLPILAWHFNRLSPLGIVLNLVAVPLSTGVLGGGLAVLLLSPVSEALARVAAWAAWWMAHALLLSAQVTRHVAWADVRVASPPVSLIVAYGILLAAVARSGRPRPRVLFLLGLVSAGIVLGPLAAGGDGRLHVTFLDVGQGDAIVLRSPNGRTMLVDAGGVRSSRFDVGASVVAPALWTQGTRSLDRLVLSHAHHDHAGGIPFLLRHFDTEEIWEGPAPLDDPDYRRFAAAARESGARRWAVRRGSAVLWDGVALEVLSPPARPAGRRTRNDDSVVLQVSFGTVSVLLTGDLEAAGEESLALEPVAVLKVPHHGSRTSSTSRLLDLSRPAIAVVSVGARNPFGHPAPDVLARYGSRGVRVLRTDECGTITFSTNGSRIWLVTFRGGPERPLR